MDGIETKGFNVATKELDALLMSNPHMEKDVQRLIRQVLAIARKEIGDSAKGIMQSDPRQAFKAVKMSVWKQVLGGSTSILSRRRASGGTSNYHPPRTLTPGQRGGNRVPRGPRTEQMNSYVGADRGFILRFFNAETHNDRMAGTRGGRLHGNRGSMPARQFFGQASQRAMEKAAQQWADLIDRLIKDTING